MIYIGIDPGKSGAIASMTCARGCSPVVSFIKCSDTEHELSDFLMGASTPSTFAFIEQVSAMPRQGVSSTFKFGQSYGFLRGLLVAHRIPFETVTPAKWQGFMRCRSGGDKNVTKAAAQRLFPDVKVTHANADALLLAEYARRIRSEV